MDNGNRNRIEHGGSGSAIEYEADEAIEFEHETEKGGEVELEQFGFKNHSVRLLT